MKLLSTRRDDVILQAALYDKVINYEKKEFFHQVAATEKQAFQYFPPHGFVLRHPATFQLFLLFI